MSALCERMIQDMQLRGLSLRTQVSYTRAIRQLAKHYYKASDLITQEELRDYFLYRKNASRWSSSASTITLCAIKFLYDNSLKNDFSTLQSVRPKRAKPEVFVWNTGSWGNEPIPHEGLIYSAAYSHDGKWLATGSFGVTTIWDTEKWQIVDRIERHDGEVTSVAFSADD